MGEPALRTSAFPVLVIGFGFAGVAAAWAAARSGARVVLVHAAAGSSALYSGIVDGHGWSAELDELAQKLGLVVGAEPRPVATREGVVRPALGRDAALLDLAPLAGKRIAVADIGRDDWDGELLAKSYADSAWARATSTSFFSARVSALARGAERRIQPYDFAQSFDTAERVEALAGALRTANVDADAWLTGAWLGVTTDASRPLSSALGKPAGEVSSPPGGPAGARFEVRAATLLRELGVEVHSGRALEIHPSARQVRPGLAALEVRLEGGVKLTARSVVIAAGGVAAGGIELSSAGLSPRRPAVLSVQAPVALELDGQVLDGVSSLSGLSFQALGLGAIERVGVRADAGGQLAPALALFGAGDVLAGRARNVVEALRSGATAGRRAALGE